MKSGVAGLKWYVAKIVYQVLVGNGTHTPQFDEQYRLIRADEVSWAWEKAQVLGRLGETSFDNNTGEKVQWKYINVSDVCAISEIEDGAQIYAQTEEPFNAGEYIALTHARADRLKDVAQQSPRSENTPWSRWTATHNLN